MKQGLFTITENERLTGTVLKMVLEGDTSAITATGQFVNVALPERYLRRPISVCDCEPGKLTLIYKIVGGGTADMAAMEPGTQLDVLTGLGNGYDLSLAGDAPLILGGGIGVPPMYWLTKELILSGCAAESLTVVLGFNARDEIFFEEEFRKLGCRVIVTTVDGSYGIKGYVTTPINEVEYSSYFACGPTPMLKAVKKTLGGRGQLSLEERMGCGFGACMGCSIKVRDGYKRVCKDGPVFRSDELVWD